MKPLYLSPEHFTKSFKLVPRLAVNLLILDDKRRFLLTKRAKPPAADYWNFPGSFLLKNETIAECIKRVAKKELNLKLNSNNIKLVGAFDDLSADPRGHVVDLIYKYVLTENQEFKPIGDTKDVQFFAAVPDKMGFNHADTLNKLGYK